MTPFHDTFRDIFFRLFDGLPLFFFCIERALWGGHICLINKCFTCLWDFKLTVSLMFKCAFSFVLQVNLIVIRPTIQAIVALTFANYALKPIYDSCDPPQAAAKLLAALCISKWKVLISTLQLKLTLAPFHIPS